MYRRILVLVNGSAASMVGLKHAIGLAHAGRVSRRSLAQDTERDTVAPSHSHGRSGRTRITSAGSSSSFIALLHPLGRGA